MSKRTSNKKGRSRKTPARSRVRLGWRKQLARQLANEQRLREAGVAI